MIFKILRTGILRTSLLGMILGVQSALAASATPNVRAPQTGMMIYNLNAEPVSIHPIKATDFYAYKVHEFTCDTLMGLDSNTYEWVPRIAEKFEISKDQMQFTFYLNKNAKFHDGKPITAEDVKFSFDAIFEPKYEAAHRRPFFDGIAKLEVVDAHTVKVYAKNKYFKNFETIAAILLIIPKHIYADAEKSKNMNKSLVCSGPYMLDKYSTGQSITIKRFKDWFGKDYPYLKGAYNFDKIVYKFFKDENIIIERLKKGDIDYYDDLRPESFGTKTKGAPWGKTIFAKNPENDSPKALTWIGWNLKRDLFKSINTRLALSYLCNRQEMNTKFNNNLMELATSPISRKSEYAPKDLKPLPFDSAKAKELLTKDGWKDEDKNGILEKMIDGKKVEFKFSLMYANKDMEKLWVMYREDLKKAGIQMDLQYLEWNSFIKNTQEGNFDALTMRWGAGSVDPDPKQIWHSSSAVQGGSNFIGYKNAEVDKLIDEAREEYDKKKRIKLLQVVYKKIAEDAPYVFLFNNKYEFYVVSNKIISPADTFNFETGYSYWWAVK